MRGRPLVDTCDTCSCVSRTRLERQKMGAQIIPDDARPTQATGGNAQVKVNGGATTYGKLGGGLSGPAQVGRGGGV